MANRNILVLHGPNVNLLGERPGDDPSWSLGTLDRALQERARALGVTLKILQSNHEGALVDALHRERHWADGVLLNPGALTHYSYVLRDAIASIEKPVVEVHISDLSKREAFRKKTVLGDVVAGRVMGMGLGSYLSALEGLVRPGAAAEKGKLGKAAQKARTPATAPAPSAKKTLGRKASPALASTASALAGKTLGKMAPKTLGRALTAPSVSNASPGKTLGRAPARSPRADEGGFLSRKLVRQKIADRLSGRLTTAGLATWARAQWLEIQRGAPAESGHRDLLDDSLQSLTLSGIPAGRLNDEQLVELMAQLGE